MRKTREELNEIVKQMNTDRLWSWSRKNCVHNSLYEYFLKYIKYVKEDRTDSIYVVTGGMAHEILERFYTSLMTKEEMLEEFDDAWTVAFEIGDLKFNRNDSEKNKNIADKYYKDLKHFFENHTFINKKIVIEDFILIKVQDEETTEYFQGYIDAQTIDENGVHTIIDFKTSSLYTGEKKNNECGQLVLYAMGLHQKGIPYEKIRICWNFLKYVNVYCEQTQYINLDWTTVKDEKKHKEKLDRTKLASTLKASVKAWLKTKKDMDKNHIEDLLNEMIEKNSIDMLPDWLQEKIQIEEIKSELKPRKIERSKMGEMLQSNVLSKMKKLGYSEDDIFAYTDMLIQTNDLNCLPDDVRNKYKVEDCYVYVDITPELIKYWEDDILSTLKMIRSKEKEYEKTKDENIWMESIEEVEKNSFYFANLCPFSANKHKPYKLYLEKLEAEQKGDIFGGTSNDLPKDTKEEKEFYDIEDLSWLEGL